MPVNTTNNPELTPNTASSQINPSHSSIASSQTEHDPHLETTPNEQAPLPLAAESSGEFATVDEDWLNSHCKHITSAKKLSHYTKISAIPCPDDAAHVIEFYTRNDDQSQWVLKRYKRSTYSEESEKNVLFAITEKIAAELHNILSPNTAPHVDIILDDAQDYNQGAPGFNHPKNNQTVTIDGVASKRFVPFISLETFLSNDAHSKITTNTNSTIVFTDDSALVQDKNVTTLPTEYEKIFKAGLETKIRWLIEETDDTFINAYTASMLLQENDLHKGNIGLTFDTKTQKLIVIRIDFDMCFYPFLESNGRSRSILDPGASLRSSASYFAEQNQKINWLLFPNPESHYNPIEYRVGALKSHAYSLEETKYFSTYLDSQNINEKRFRCFLKYFLLPDHLLAHIFDNQEALKQYFINQREKVKLDFFKMPGTIKWIQELPYGEVLTIVKEVENQYLQLNNPDLKPSIHDTHRNDRSISVEMITNYHKIMRDHNLHHLSRGLFSLQQQIISPIANASEKQTIQEVIHDLRETTADFFSINSSEVTSRLITDYAESIQSNIETLQTRLNKKTIEALETPINHLKNYIAHFIGQERPTTTANTSNNDNVDSIYQQKGHDGTSTLSDNFETFCVNHFCQIFYGHEELLSNAIIQLQEKIIAIGPIVKNAANDDSGAKKIKDPTKKNRDEAHPIQKIVLRLSALTITLRQTTISALSLYDIATYSRKIQNIINELENDHQIPSSQKDSPTALLQQYLLPTADRSPSEDASFENIHGDGEFTNPVFIPLWEEYYLNKLLLAIEYLETSLRQFHRAAICEDNDQTEAKDKKTDFKNRLRNEILATYKSLSTTNITGIYTLLPGFIDKIKKLIVDAEKLASPLVAKDLPVFEATIALKKFINDVTNQQVAHQKTSTEKISNTKIQDADREILCALTIDWAYKQSKKNKLFFTNLFNEAHESYAKKLQDNHSLYQTARSFLMWTKQESIVPLSDFSTAVNAISSAESLNDFKCELHKLLMANEPKDRPITPSKLKDAVLNTLLDKFLSSLTKRDKIALFMESIERNTFFPTCLLYAEEKLTSDPEIKESLCVAIARFSKSTTNERPVLNASGF